jgi:hypothetical protein
MRTSLKQFLFWDVTLWLKHRYPRFQNSVLCMSTSCGDTGNTTATHWKNKGNAKRGVSPRLKIKTLWPWPLTLKINRVPDSPKDYVCTKFGQNPLKDVDSRVFTRMLRSKNLTLWHWRLTLKINRVPDSPKD